MSKKRYIEKLSIALKTDIPQLIIPKEKLMNYYIHDFQRGWESLTVNDIIKAAIMAGKKVKGNSLLEINVSFKEQLEFYAKEVRIRNGRTNRYDATKILEKNKELVIGSFLNNIPIKTIAENFNCGESTVRRYLTEKGIREKRVRQKKSLTWERDCVDTSKIITGGRRGRGNRKKVYLDV